MINFLVCFGKSSSFPETMVGGGDFRCCVFYIIFYGEKLTEEIRYFCIQVSLYLWPGCHPLFCIISSIFFYYSFILCYFFVFQIKKRKGNCGWKCFSLYFLCFFFNFLYVFFTTLSSLVSFSLNRKPTKKKPEYRKQT